MNHYRIEGNADLARDPKNNSIINVNTMDYEQYIMRRNVKSESSKKIQNIEDEIANVKGDLAEIKLLLKEIINESR